MLWWSLTHTTTCSTLILTLRESLTTAERRGEPISGRPKSLKASEIARGPLREIGYRLGVAVLIRGTVWSLVRGRCSSSFLPESSCELDGVRCESSPQARGAALRSDRSMAEARGSCSPERSCVITESEIVSCVAAAGRRETPSAGSFLKTPRLRNTRFSSTVHTQIDHTVADQPFESSRQTAQHP